MIKLKKIVKKLYKMRVKENLVKMKRKRKKRMVQKRRNMTLNILVKQQEVRTKEEKNTLQTSTT